MADAIRDHYKPVGAQDDVAPERRVGGRRARRPARHARRVLRRGPRADGRRRSLRAAPRVHRGAAHAARPRPTPLVASRSSWASRTTVCEGKKLDLSRVETVAKRRRSSRPSACAGCSRARRARRWPTRCSTAPPRRRSATSSPCWRARARCRPWSTRRSRGSTRRSIVAKRLSGISREAKPVLHGAGDVRRRARSRRRRHPEARRRSRRDRRGR